jgi:phosphoribosyl 1,2-cyclic phosphodiesterase
MVWIFTIYREQPDRRKSYFWYSESNSINSNIHTSAPFCKGGLRGIFIVVKGIMRFSVLASGSSGNAYYVETENAGILVDAGLSCREIERRLELVGVKAKELDALIVTHEHTDHIKGAGPLARRFDLPVYLNKKTFEKGRKALGNLPRPVIFQTGQAMTINDLCVETFTKCHDAVDPFGLVLSSNGTRIGLSTDLGKSTRLVEDRLKGCDVLILEFNYDQEMLEQGPYPLYIKRRIKGSEGHLSNEQASDLLRVISKENLRVVVLAHLSEINNQPDKAHREAEQALGRCGLTEANILIGKQDEPGPMIEV